MLQPVNASFGEVNGQVTVDECPAGLASKLARVLAQPQVSQLGIVKVVRADSDRVTFEQAAQVNRQAACRIREGEVRFERAESSSSLARYRLLIDERCGLLVAAQGILILGLVAIVGVGAVMAMIVVPSPDAATRWQTIQSCLLVHVLWPPFMLAAQYRNGRKMAVGRIEILLANLPHLA